MTGAFGDGTNDAPAMGNLPAGRADKEYIKGPARRGPRLMRAGDQRDQDQPSPPNRQLQGSTWQRRTDD
jgi:hypothetical protein